jgi:hypothetical protein
LRNYLDAIEKQIDDKEVVNEVLPSENKPTDNKRLFRDTDNAMLVGVAAGLAKYFGIDVLLGKYRLRLQTCKTAR